MNLSDKNTFEHRRIVCNDGGRTLKVSSLNDAERACVILSP